MKTSLDHLPESKREQLQAIVAAVQAQVKVDMIILFGSYARGDWVEDHATLYYSDFDLMIVVDGSAVAEDDALWQRVSDEARCIAGHIPVTVMPHEVRELNEEIRSGQYFFADVVKEGILLFDSGRHTLAKPKAHTPEQRLRIALFNFRYWFKSACRFWCGAGFYMAHGDGPQAAFLLHQATERYFHAVLLVYTGYKPKSHDIEALGKQTTPLHEALDWVLSHKQGPNANLYSLLKRAYIEARYDKSYSITLDELAALRRHILDLGERVLRACVDKLWTFAAAAGVDDLGELPTLPTPSDSIELPDIPSLDNRHAVEAWRDALVQMSQEFGERRGEERGRQEGLREGERRGEERGRQEGLREGEERGRQEGLELGRQEGLREGERRGEELGRDEGRREGAQAERARAILGVLERRGITLNDAQTERIATCRDDMSLSTWWERAWSASSGDEVLDGT